MKIEKENRISPIQIKDKSEIVINPEARTRWQKPAMILKVVNQLKLTNNFPSTNTAKERSKKLEDILTGVFPGKIKLFDLPRGFIGILLSTFFSITMTLWPQHNVIEDPKYWYECMLVIATGYAPIAAANIVFSSFYCMGLELKRVIKPLLFVYISGATITILLSCLLYVIWIFAVDSIYPMPFQGYLVGFFTWHLMTISLWFQIPNTWRKNYLVRKRFKYAILLLFVISATEVAYKIVRKIFLVIPSDYQWSLFIVLIIIRELHAKILSSLGRKIA